MSHTYKLSYRIEPKPGGFSRDEAIARMAFGDSACDAVLIASIIYPDDGSLSIHFVGKDGRSGGDLEDPEWFKVWCVLSERLARSATLDRSKAEFCRLAWEVVSRRDPPPADDPAPTAPTPSEAEN